MLQEMAKCKPQSVKMLYVLENGTADKTAMKVNLD